uniref:C2H2-type domain-containing protein n=1 Tax=Macrostomum lignano TaxID=282301 RepID=A0A1I8IUY0_9PLAT
RHRDSRVQQQQQQQQQQQLQQQKFGSENDEIAENSLSGGEFQPLDMCPCPSCGLLCPSQEQLHRHLEQMETRLFGVKATSSMVFLSEMDFLVTIGLKSPAPNQQRLSALLPLPSRWSQLSSSATRQFRMSFKPRLLNTLRICLSHPTESGSRKRRAASEEAAADYDDAEAATAAAASKSARRCEFTADAGRAAEVASPLNLSTTAEENSPTQPMEDRDSNEERPLSVNEEAEDEEAESADCQPQAERPQQCQLSCSQASC